MSSSNLGAAMLRAGSTGRGFACMDPERQSEIPRDAAGPRQIRTATRPVRPARMDWTRLQVDRDYEGGSSRHSR